MLLGPDVSEDFPPLSAWAMLGFAAILGSVTVLALGQDGATKLVPANAIGRCVEQYDATRDYFPDKVTVEDAANFAVTYTRSYKVVSVRAAAGSPADRYVLVQCGTPPPRLEGKLAGARVVSVPIASLYSTSTTHLSLLVDLQRLDVLTGVAQMRYLVGDEILTRAKSGRVREFAPLYVIDAELVVSERPALLMTDGYESSPLSVIRSAGIPVVTNTEWLEQTALARAEWLKYMALFLNEEGAAQRLFSETKARYTLLSARASAVAERSKPLVMVGQGTRGNFVTAGGRSYVAMLIKDAGGRYVWADDAAPGSRTIDLEMQIQRAANADIWINGGEWPSLSAMEKDEPRYRAFKAYRTGQVWVYERSVAPNGGNDYWSRGVSHPDLLLADLAKIFHPDLVAEHRFEWYMQVPPR